MKQMFKQIRDFMENAFSKFQCGFRKGYSTQQCLIALIKNGNLLLKSYLEYHMDLFQGLYCLIFLYVSFL